MAAASPLRRAVLAVVSILLGMTVAVLVGFSQDSSGFGREWVAVPLAPTFLRQTAMSADVVLDALKVILVAASAALVVVRMRESRGRGLLVAVMLLLSNASVQGLKHWPGQHAGAATVPEPLSGHAALVAAVALTWLVTLRTPATRWAASTSAASITLTCLIAVVPGQHSPIQVACPLVICLGWAVALLLLQPGHPEGNVPRGGLAHPHTPWRRRIPPYAVFATSGLLLVLLSLAPPASWGLGPAAPETNLRLLLVAAFVAGSALLVVGATVAGSAVLSSPLNRGPSADREYACDAPR